jgi:hypothetical protein
MQSKLPEETRQNIINNSLTYLSSLYSEGYVKGRYKENISIPLEWSAIRNAHQAGATEWAQWKVKHDEAKKLLDEVFQKHESGLLPDRFVYDKIKMFLYGE